MRITKLDACWADPMETAIKLLRSKPVVVASLLLALFLIPMPVRGQEIDQTVARLSFVSGAVSYSRGDDPDFWDPAEVNVPFTLADRLYTSAEGRAELQLPAGNFIRLAPRTYFTTLNLTYDTRQFYLGEGSASFNIRSLDSQETFEIATPNIAVTFDAPGRYRIEVDEDGNTRVQVRRGRVLVAALGRQITVGEGELRVYGIDSPRYEIVPLRDLDAFDRWVSERDGRFERAYARVHPYAGDQHIGVEDLGEHGRWEQIPEYGYAWTPDRVPVGWQPYTLGRWFWQDPWGWTWISEEPWGWAPSHYGRWTRYRSRWYWVPVRQRVRFVRYEPACVEFVRVRDGVGWFPLHPRDRFTPRRRWRGTPQNVTYVNRQYVTVVNQNIFISGRKVTANIVRDGGVLTEARSVRVAEHSLPVPTRSSLRLRAEREIERLERPPDKVLTRPVVVRATPAPLPPRFEDKLPEIQKSRGEPVTPEKATVLTQKNTNGRQRHPLRSAAATTERAEFAPRHAGAPAPVAEPLTAKRAPKLATEERAPGAGAQTDQAGPARVESKEEHGSKPNVQEQDRDMRKREQQVQEKRPAVPQKEQEQSQQTQLQGQRDEQQRRRQVERQRQEAQELLNQKLKQQKQQQAHREHLEVQKQQARQQQQRQRELEQAQELARQRQAEQAHQQQVQKEQRQAEQQKLRAAQQHEAIKRQELARQQQELHKQRKAQQLLKEQKRQPLEGVPQRPPVITP